MTEAEQHQIIGEVVSELSAEKRQLACLETKAEKLALEFGVLTNWLNGHFPSGVDIAEGLSVSGALALVEQTKQAKARIEQLEARRRQLGV